MNRRYGLKTNNSNLLFKLVVILLSFCVLKINANAAAIGDVKNFGYTGGQQTFTAPATGIYRLEVWGAGGGTASAIGGYGAYATGFVRLEKDQTIYVVVGNVGGSSKRRENGYNYKTDAYGGYNGGGNAVSGCGSAGGGGATHIAFQSGLLDSFSSKRDQVLIAAGAGGGGEYWYKTSRAGGHAGGYTNSYSGGHQSGWFGHGGNGRGNACGGGGGGGGWMGGFGGGNVQAGTGGSSYIGNSLLLSDESVQKHMTCYSCSTNTAAENYTISNGRVSGTATTDYAKSGTGYARITLTELSNTNAYLESLDVTSGIFDVDFNPETLEYNVLLDSESSNVDISAVPQESTSVVSGVGNFDIEAGLSTYDIAVTADAGNVLVYKLNITRLASSYKYLKDIKIGDESISNFSPTKLTYNINVPYDVEILDLDIVKGRTSQTLYLPSDLSLKSGNNIFNITVISEDGNNSTTYVLNVFREHSSKLKSLSINDYDFTPEFDPDENVYNVSILASTMTLKINATAYDDEANITLSGFGYIKKSGIGTITVTEPNSQTNVYKIIIDKADSGEEIIYNYPYSGKQEQFVAPYTGYYQLETWGAAGGNSSLKGGYGAYATGVVFLKRDDILYVNVGGVGGSTSRRDNSYTYKTDAYGGYNGGGNAVSGCGSGAGGGATHIATTSGVLSSLSSQRDKVLIVSGAGGGAEYWYRTSQAGGHAGGYTNSSSGGYQSGGFGYGGSGRGNACGGGGGGAGWTGGFGGANVQAGTGGSSYIGNENLISYKEYTKSMYCYNCATSNNESTYTVNTGNVSSNPVSYYAKSGSGYARITLLPQPSENNFLSNITVKGINFDTGESTEKTYTPTFDMAEEDYYVTFNDLETSIYLHARPEDSTAKIEGLGTFDVPSGESVYEIKVIAEAGNEKIYKIHVTRAANSNQYPYDIHVAGLVPSLCGSSETFCNLNPAVFNKNTQTYYLTVPSRIKQLWFNVDKGHPYQEVNGDGKVTLKGGENTFTITITSEDSQNHSVYNYVVTRDMTGNNDLSVLNILNPERIINYDQDILEYYISVPNEIETYQINNTNEIDELKENVLQIYVEQDDPNATFVVNGNENLQVGINQIRIIVTAANGEIKTYVINVYRERNTNVFLSDLSIEKNNTTYEISPEFNKINTGVYNATVPNNISDVDIIAHAEVPSTTSVSGTGNKQLNTGNNTFNIVTTSESGDTETYKINIYREKNSNAYLSNLSASIDNVEKIDNFNKNTLEYSFSVEEGTTSIDISATSEVNTTTYRLLDNNTIKVGENKKRIMTVAEDGTTLTYVITINRPASTNNLLSSLTVYNDDKEFSLTPEFDKEEDNYTLTVDNNVSWLNVYGTKENELAQVLGNGKYNLKVGKNDILITVTSESGLIKNYTIVVTRKPNSNANLSRIDVSAGELSPNFESDEINYEVEVDANTHEITITGVPEVNTTTVSGNQTYQLTIGDNFIDLVTLAEDNTSTKTYHVKVIKEESSNNKLKNLILKEGALRPTFNSNTEEYNAVVPYSKDKAHFIVELDDNRSTYEVINDDLEVGDNEVIVRVTAQDNTSKDYTVTITRLDEETSRNTKLLKIQTDVGTLVPSFDPEESYYEIELDYDIKNITVTAETEVEYSSLVGTGTYSLNVGDNLITVKVTSADNYTRDYQILVKRKANTEARLKVLNISGIELSPLFSSDVYEYDLETNDDHLTFTSIVPIDSNATYEIIGNEFNEVGDYTVKIKVTAANKVNTKEYKLNVNKLPSNNNNLKRLEVEGYAINPTFSANTTVYNLTVDNSVNTINIIAESYDRNATITGDGLQNLETGINYFTVEVASESGKIKTYTIVVTKAGSSNNNVEELEVLNGVMTPSYTNDNPNYNVEIPYEEDSLDLKVKLSDEKATYNVVGNENLQVGQNLVKVLVTAENGSIKTINLNVTRKEIVSALLKNIKIKNYEISPEFNSYVFNYNVTIDNEINTLIFDNITTLDPSATYIVRGNESLVVGNNIVEIEVTSSNKVDTQTYTINVNKQAYSNTYLDYLYTSNGDVIPTFNKEVLDYSIDVDYAIEEIELYAETIDKSAKVETLYNGVTREALKDEQTHKYNGELGKFNLNTGENKVTIIVTSTSGIKRKYYVTINRAKNNNNYLSSLSAKIGANSVSISPEFNKTVEQYTINVPIGTKSINLSATAESASSTISGEGIHSLVAGENIFKIIVTGENGATREYTVTVNRPKNNNRQLIEIIPSSGVLIPDFNYDIDDKNDDIDLSDRTYTLNLDSSVAYLSFDVELEDANATATGYERQLVSDGLSTREITVTAEDGSAKKYVININKERTDNAKLSNLYVVGYNFVDENNDPVSFDPDVHEYRINVENAKKILMKDEVIATTDDPNAKITKDTNLTLSSSNENIYIVRVTAPDGFTKEEYKIIITRAKNNIALLNNLEVNVGYLTSVFNPNVKEYTWMVPKNTILNESSVSAVAQDPNANIIKTPYLTYVNGEENIYEVMVISEDGNVSVTYRLRLELDLSTDATLSNIEIDKGYYEPAFNSEIKEYEVYEYVDEESINVLGIPNQETSTVVSGNGDVELTSDVNVHYIRVQAEDGVTEEEYKLNIHRNILRDETLRNIGLNNLDGLECIDDKCILSPTYNEDVVSYKIKVPYEYDNLDVLYETKNEQQKVKMRVGENYIENGNYSLPVGKTKVKLEVYDGMNKKTKEYELEVERCKNNNTYLKKLEIKKNENENYELDPEFNKQVQEYTIFVDKDTTDLSLSDFTAEPEFEESRVTISGYTYLEEGNNDCEITVTANDGSERTYILHIFRESEYNSRLKNITVSTGVFYNLSPQFKSTTYEYSVIVPGSETRATVEAFAQDVDTVITEQKQEIDLVTGNNIVTIRTNNHGQESVYTVNVIKQPNIDVDLISLIVDEGNISPTFDRSTTRYSVNVGEEVEELTIHAIASSNEANVKIVGNQNLKSGKNTINIIVENKDKTMSKTYQLTVNKALSSNNKLGSLRVYKGNTNYELDPVFDEEEHYYRVVVNNDVEKVEVEAKAKNEKSNVIGNGEEYLEYGDNIKEITVTAENGNIDTYRVNIHRNYNLNLESIEIDQGELDPKFSPSKTEYTVEVEKDVEKINVVGKAESNKVMVNGNGEFNLQPGENEIELEVVAPDGEKKTYKITVNKKMDDNNYIKELQVEGVISPTFDKEVKDYEVDVRKEVTKLKINVLELESEKATYEIIGNENFSQNNNPNIVIIKVTSESEKVREYKLKVNLREDEYFSNRLISLEIDKGQLTPDFNPDINNYATTVSNSIDKIKIDTIKENEHSTVKINNILGGSRELNLSLGRNEIEIKVISQDNKENIYSLVVYRIESADATLSSLVVEGQNYYPIFNKGVEDYNLEVGSEIKDLNIIATPSDENAKVEISGNKNLVSGINIVKVKVTAPDNITTKEYKITVNKSVSRNNYIKELSVLDQTLDKTFTKTDQGPYTINVGTNVSSIMINALPEVETTTISGDGKVNLSKGKNVIQVSATSESNETRVYTLIVNRAYNDDAYLTNILISDGELDPEFNKNTFIYEVEVDESVEEVSVTGILSDNNASITGNDTYDLTENEETNVTLKVTAENTSTTKEYKIKFIRHINASSYLSKLVVRNGELYPGFHKLITAYTILVPNEVRSLDMTYVKEDEEASVQVTGNSSFKVGTNKVHVVVTAKDNSSTTDYEISVVRQSKASNYLKTLDVSGYQLQPTFNKETMYYEVNVGENVETVNVFAEAEDQTATIDSTDLGYKTISYGENRFYVTVESASGAVRTYQVVVNKAKSTENKLLTLTSDVGVWNKEFDSEENSYQITVSEKTEKITLEGSVSINSSVNGLGTSDVNLGSQTRTITVTSQSGEVNIYTVEIIRPASKNVNVISLIPSSGELDPEFNNNVNDYEITVSDSTNIISFEVVPEDIDTTVEGNEMRQLEYGENEITITLTAEDQETTREIKIKVTREKDLISIIASEEEILIEKEEEKEITYVLHPIDTTYQEVEWRVQDESIATVENGVIKGKKYGSTIVQIVSKHDENIYATITVNVASKTIQSNEYEVVHFSEEDLEGDAEGKENYVIGFEPKTKISEIIPKFENNENTLHFYDKEENEIFYKDETVKTGMKIKLIINGQEYDEVTIVVRGDINGDGIINVNDYKKLNNYVLKTITFNYIEKKASDLNKDTIINVNDYKKLNNYVLKNISSVN